MALGALLHVKAKSNQQPPGLPLPPPRLPLSCLRTSQGSRDPFECFLRFLFWLLVELRTSAWLTTDQAPSPSLENSKEGLHPDHAHNPLNGGACRRGTTLWPRP